VGQVPFWMYFICGRELFPHMLLVRLSPADRAYGHANSVFDVNYTIYRMKFAIWYETVDKMEKLLETTSPRWIWEALSFIALVSFERTFFPCTFFLVERKSGSEMKRDQHLSFVCPHTDILMRIVLFRDPNSCSFDPHNIQFVYCFFKKC
jgi:hypothetical protein